MESAQVQGPLGFKTPWGQEVAGRLDSTGPTNAAAAFHTIYKQNPKGGGTRATTRVTARLPSLSELFFHCT